MVGLIINLEYLILVSVPLVVSMAPLVFATNHLTKILSIASIGPLFVLSFLVLAGCLSMMGRKGLIEGKFLRSLSDKTYGLRRIHATPWTFVYYAKPLYFLYLSIAPLKKILFRLFGYKGQLDFVVYPDTWLRDLPLLDIGKGAYLSNKSSIATNICLMSGHILVEGISIGEKACVGHGTIVGPGTQIGERTQIEASVTSGIRVKYGSNVQVGELCGIQHGIRVGDNTIIEAVCVIGLRCVIGPNIKIKEGSHIHSGTKIKTQEEADKYYSQETGALTLSRVKAMQRFEHGVSSTTSAMDTKDFGEIDVKQRFTVE